MSLPPTNEELLSRYQDAEFEAFDLFYRRHHALILGYLHTRLGNRPDAEEVFQETFVRIHRSIQSYDPSQSALAWVFTIARNVAVDYTRRSRRQRFVALEDDVAAVVPRSEEALVAREELGRVLARLSADERELLESRFLADDSFDAIAERRGTSAANARQKLSRLLKKLKTDSAP